MTLSWRQRIAGEIPFVTESPILHGLITLKYAGLALRPRAASGVPDARTVRCIASVSVS